MALIVLDESRQRRKAAGGGREVKGKKIKTRQNRGILESLANGREKKLSWFHVTQRLASAGKTLHGRQAQCKKDEFADEDFHA